MPWYSLFKKTIFNKYIYIGKGGFACVYKGEWKNSQYALKYYTLYKEKQKREEMI